MLKQKTVLFWRKSFIKIYILTNFKSKIIIRFYNLINFNLRENYYGRLYSQASVLVLYWLLVGNWYCLANSLFDWAITKQADSERYNGKKHRSRVMDYLALEVPVCDFGNSTQCCGVVYREVGLLLWWGITWKSMQHSDFYRCFRKHPQLWLVSSYPFQYGSCLELITWSSQRPQTGTERDVHFLQTSYVHWVSLPFSTNRTANSQLVCYVDLVCMG